MLATGHDALSSYRRLFDAAFLNHGALGDTLVSATPLAFTGLAAAAAFRMRLFNIGGEGQLYIGAITGAAAGLYFGGGGGPSAFAIAAMVVAGCAGGAAWALIPGILRAFFRTNEIITSLMLNYVAGYLLTYLIFNSQSYFRQTTGFNASVFPTSKELPSSAVWPAATVHVHGGVALPLGAGIAILVAASPTRGLDVGAIESVHSYLHEAAASGVGVLLLSEDLDEILTLADRIAVVYEGRIAGETPRAGANVEEIGLLMAGGNDPRRD